MDDVEGELDSGGGGMTGAHILMEGAVSGTPFQCGQQVGLRGLTQIFPHLPAGVDKTEFAQGLISAGLAHLQATCGNDAARHAVESMIAATERADLSGATH